MIISKQGTFEAAHMLSDYTGPCANLHGHSYSYQIEIEGYPQADGMVLDFTVISRIIKDNFDHRLIVAGLGARDAAEQELFEWAVKHGKSVLTLPANKRPTAENIASFLKEAIEAFDGVRSVKVSVRETATSEAIAC